eukprot:sb/3470270/
MLDRMTPHDDARGLQRGLNDNLATPGKLRLLLERRSQVVNTERDEAGSVNYTGRGREAEGRSTEKEGAGEAEGRSTEREGGEAESTTGEYTDQRDGEAASTAGYGEYGYTVEFPSQLSHLVQQSLLHQPYISYNAGSRQELPEPIQLMYEPQTSSSHLNHVIVIHICLAPRPHMIIKWGMAPPYSAICNFQAFTFVLSRLAAPAVCVQI